MASQNKIKKLKNSYCCYGALKNKKLKLKRTMFYNASQRKDLNSNIKKGAYYEF